MILKNIKKFGSAQAGSDIRDAVLTVPAHWGFKARMALVNAASIADLSVLGILNENSAAAIHFAITRNDSEAINIGFFNLGSHNLQISIIQFFGTPDLAKGKNIESMRVLAHVSVPGVGGLSVDL
jgi:molecular chaperone DnaK (HSP70)